MKREFDPEKKLYTLAILVQDLSLIHICLQTLSQLYSDSKYLGNIIGIINIIPSDLPLSGAEHISARSAALGDLIDGRCV